MKIAGVIVEYNPFHNGHYYHIQETKKKTNASLVVAIMSGNFLQRGEPALVSKWARAKMALAGGADLVIELPYAFATQHATIFAKGAIALLDALHVDVVCFGSESGNIADFYVAMDNLEKHKDVYENRIKLEMKQGNSYPKAASRAFEYINQQQTLDISQPNNILGFQYLNAIKQLQSPMQAETIKRTGSHYHDETFSHHIASATSIRKTLEKSSSLAAITNVVPETTYNELVAYIDKWKHVHTWEHYFPLLKYKLLTSSSEELKQIYEMEEGLEHRFISKIKNSATFAEFLQAVKTKRYTWTRLQRICVHLLTNTTKEEMLSLMNSPAYIRLLGMTQHGQEYLNKIKKRAKLPIISRLSAFDDKQLELDIRAVNAYSSMLPEPLMSEMIAFEYSSHPIIYR